MAIVYINYRKVETIHMEKYSICRFRYVLKFGFKSRKGSFFSYFRRQGNSGTCPVYSSMIPVKAHKISSSVSGQLLRFLASFFGSFFKNFCCSIKQLIEKVLSELMCLAGLFGFIKVRRFFIFSYIN